MNGNELAKQQANERAGRIREHREEVIARRPRLHIISTKVTSHAGRIVTEYLIDASRELGRGRGYSLVCG